MTNNEPQVGDSAGQFSRWLFLVNADFTKIIGERLGEESVSSYAEIEEGDEKVFLKECEKCDLPTITHSSLDRPTCLFMNNGLEAIKANIDELLKDLTKTQEGKENLSVALMEEIEKLPEFEQAKTLLEELKTRTCICKKVCVNERGLQVHKRKCEVSKTAITRELSNASSNNENTMMVQLMSQMREDRKEDRKAQQEQTQLLAKLCFACFLPGAIPEPCRQLLRLLMCLLQHLFHSEIFI